ncbi:uncharacterized protein UHOR_14724 [Ustilago hordei]|uniref:Reverse transcriptase Ty1/copia-type domain-containing protein n=1 Tax=Ustilago hordei TaxID=120017 RepID=I2FVP2_USTHO|nr:uncharacterized protein UHOR_14724 [Ustilago hordei]
MGVVLTSVLLLLLLLYHTSIVPLPLHVDSSTVPLSLHADTPTVLFLLHVVASLACGLLRRPCDIGFHCMPSALCLYTRGTGDWITIITAYVDDMLVASLSHREMDHTKAKIMNKWGTEDNGMVKELLGVKITQERA